MNKTTTLKGYRADFLGSILILKNEGNTIVLENKTFMVKLDLFRFLRMDIRNSFSDEELYALIEKSMKIGIDEINSISFLKWRDIW